MGFRRVLALVMSAMMLLTPVMGSAEEVGFSAGDLTATTLSESYSGGYQINAGFGFDVDDEALAAQGERMKAAAALLEEAQVNLSFYDDFGTARIRGGMTLDGVDIVTGDMLIFEDGSVQLVTSLTGNLVFALPAGTVTEEGIVLPEFDWLSQPKYEWQDEDEVPAYERLQYSGANMISTVVNLLLGWVSGVQMETGELYTFDYETYIDATETRDAVATRMIGKIRSNDLLKFMWNVVSHIRDRETEFQSDLAYTLGNAGLTRYDARKAIDALFPNDEVDCAALEIEPSENIPDDGAPFRFDDIRYVLSKLEASLMNAWGTNTMDTTSSMIVSYDDFGAMVGFDAELARFSKYYPYEGSFTYSIKTDDNWQRLHTSHGEMQLYNDQRLVGDLNIQFGEDVNGVKESHFIGQIDLVDQKTGAATGFGVNSGLDFAVAPDQSGEAIEGLAEILLHVAGESIPAVCFGLSADSALTDMGLTLTGALTMDVISLPQTKVNIGVECVDYDEAPYEGGQAVDLSGEVSAQQLDAIKREITNAATGLALKFALKPAVMSNAMKLLEGF